MAKLGEAACNVPLMPTLLSTECLCVTLLVALMPVWPAGAGPHECLQANPSLCAHVATWNGETSPCFTARLCTRVYLAMRFSLTNWPCPARRHSEKHLGVYPLSSGTRCLVCGSVQLHWSTAWRSPSCDASC